MKFFVNMFLDNRSKPREFKAHSQRSRSQDRIFGFFTIARWGKKFADTITDELLHSAWWIFAWICSSTTSRSLLNFKVIRQRSKSHGFCSVISVHHTAATRGQYLALSKAWWSCFASIFVFLCILVRTLIYTTCVCLIRAACHGDFYCVVLTRDIIEWY